MTPAARIINKFGGIRPLASRLQNTPPSTVQGWMERGTIPVRRAPEIIAAGADLADPVTPSDFIPLPNVSETAPAEGAAA